MKLKSGDSLLKEANKLGVSTSNLGGPEDWSELQRRVMDAKRFKRESLAWLVALVSALASLLSAAAAWYAVVYKTPCP